MHRLVPNKVVFMCCDIQEVFRPTIYRFEHVVNTACILTQAAKLFKAPLIVSEQYPEKLGKTVAEIDISHAFKVYSKTKFSMVTDSYPSQELTTRHTYILFGIESHVCILQTALDLLNQGDQVYLVTDGISSSRPLDRSTALHRLSNAGAILITAESVLFELARTKDAPEFKEVSALAKSLAGFYRDNVQKCLCNL